MSLDPAKIARLRAVLIPRRERHDFAYTMSWWAELVSDASDVVQAGPFEPPSRWPADDGVDLVAELLGRKRVPPLRTKGQGPPPPNKRGRRPLDQERWAAAVLSVIFHEFVEAPPTRVWDEAGGRGEVSPFYRFATAAFEAIGLKPSDEVFRHACKAWNAPTKHLEFDREAIERLLWSGLVPRD